MSNAKITRRDYKNGKTRLWGTCKCRCTWHWSGKTENVVSGIATIAQSGCQCERDRDFTVDLIAQRDRARATAVALDAELLALKELAAEVCSAYRAGMNGRTTGDNRAEAAGWERCAAGITALEQAVWGDR